MQSLSAPPPPQAQRTGEENGLTNQSVSDGNASLTGGTQQIFGGAMWLL